MLTGLSPTQGRIGGVVTLTGRHFGLRRAVVRFGATIATRLRQPKRLEDQGQSPSQARASGSVKVTVTTLIGRSAPRSFFRL